MATETDRPHRRSLREIREAGWQAAKEGRSRAAVSLLREARSMENKEAKRVEREKAKSDSNVGVNRRDNKVTRLELDRIGTNEDGDSIIQMKKK